jgi:hypothetical protein
MKKTLLVAVALCLALTAKVFAEEAKKAPEAKPTTTAATVKPTTTTPATTPTTTATAKPTTTTTSTDSLLKGSIVKLDNTNLYVKDNAGKEWNFKAGTVSLKDYKVGDNVEVKYEKDNLKSIAKATK